MKEYAAPNDSVFLTDRRFNEKSEPGNYKREEYQRDRDRIMHSRSFRRMMHKTQIFNANTGDHYRNRLTHTLEVSQIARSIGKILKLNDELIEAIALGHDLGHTPFGHTGERILSELLFEKKVDEIDPIRERFKHNFQSLRVVDLLETRCEEYAGINLTLAVREGILKHTKTTLKDGTIINYPQADLKYIDVRLPSFTLEGQVVAIADEVAQCTHDLEDGVRSGIMSFKDILNNDLVKKVIEEYGIYTNSQTEKPAYDTRNVIIKNMVGYLINDICNASQKRIEIYYNKFSPTFICMNDVFKEKCIDFTKDTGFLVKELTDKILSEVICSEKISVSDAKSEYFIKQLFKAYYIHPKQLPDYVLRKYCESMNMKFDRLTLDKCKLTNDPIFVRAICDHIAGMTDQFASREYIKLYLPEHYSE